MKPGLIKLSIFSSSKRLPFVRGLFLELISQKSTFQFFLNPYLIKSFLEKGSFCFMSEIGASTPVISRFPELSWILVQVNL